MISITNLFSNSSESEKKKRVSDSATAYTKHKFPISAPTPSLSQGDKFKKYQKKIKKNLEKNAEELSGKEGFVGINLNMMNLPSNSLAKQSNSIIQSNDFSQQQQTITNLQQQYNNTLAEYQKIVDDINKAATNYIDRTGPNNPYLGKNIQFNDGSLFYVTKQGIAKPYANTQDFNATSGSNGCPSNYTKINMTVNGPFTPGTTLPTNPTLIVGTPMVKGQSCGYEGQNVYVNQILSNPSTSYVGCYADNTSSPLMTFIGGSPPPPTAIQNGNFSQPQLTTNSYTGYWGSNAIPGWYFNAWLVNSSTQWTFPIPYPSGDQCAVIQSYQYINQNISLQTGTTYSLSFMACGNNNINITLNASGSSTQIYSLQPTNQWASYSTTFTVPTSQNYVLYFSGVSQSTNDYTGIQNIQLNAGTSSSGSYTYNQCQQAAMDNGYQYFALQNVNSATAQGYCAVSNSQPVSTSLGESYVPNSQLSLWSSNTSGQTGNTATLTNIGSLSVVNSNGQSVFITPNSSAQPSNYLGCYADGSPRAMTLYNGGSGQYDLQQCQQIAQQNGSTYFGLQNSTSGTNAQCTLSSDFSEVSQYGGAGNCTQISDGSWSGGGGSNAVYNTNSSNSNYFLILQDDGNMCVYRGTGPNDNQGQIWCSGTNGQQQDANPAYVAANGKYGQNWIASGSTLAAGDFVGSNNGNLALIMQSDGNLVLYTFTNVLNCQQMTDGNTGGGAGANAIYNIGTVGNPNNVGQLGYIDKNSGLTVYEDSNIQFSNNYTEFSAMNSSGNDIPNASYNNATVQQCESTCNNNPQCAGFVMSSSALGSTCYPKTNGIYPNTSSQTDSNYTTYVRGLEPIQPAPGISNIVNQINSILFGNYQASDPNVSQFNLSSATSVQKQQLSQLQSQLDLLSSQINNLTNQFSTGTEKTQVQNKKNIAQLGTYLTDLTQTNAQIKGFNTTADNILNDSDIVVLQKNYDYLFWSILAVGAVLISINLAKK